MPFWTIFLGSVTGAALGVMAAMGLLLVVTSRQAPKAKSITLPEPPAAAPPESEATQRLAAVGRSILAGPPMVGAATLRDWLIYYHRSDDVWAHLVEDFYTDAAADPIILEVFQDAADRRGVPIGELVMNTQRHFLSMLLILTHVGLTARLADSLEASHRELALSGEVYDRTITKLVEVLTRYGVQVGSLQAMGPIVAELRTRMVAA